MELSPSLSLPWSSEQPSPPSSPLSAQLSLPFPLLLSAYPSLFLAAPLSLSVAAPLSPASCSGSTPETGAALETPPLPASASPASSGHSFRPSFSSRSTLEELVGFAAGKETEKEKVAAHEKTACSGEKEENASAAAGPKEKIKTEDAANDSCIKMIIKKLEGRFLKRSPRELAPAFLGNSHGSYRPLPLRGYSQSPAGQLFTAGSNDVLKGFYGGSNVRTDMYKEFYEEGATKLSQRYTQESKYSDIGYQDIMGIVWTNVKNKTFSSSTEFAGTEQVAAHLREKWSILKIFPTYQVMAMLNYQTALT